MNSRDNYKDLIESVFGICTAKFDIKSSYSNNIIGALNNIDNFAEFRNNFIARLNRLNIIYNKTDDNRKNIIDQVNQIASDNWEGAYSELVAFEYMNRDVKGHRYLHEPIVVNHDINNNRTYSMDLGKTGKANVDGFIDDYGIYFDVKSLKDNVDEILKGIYKEFKNKLN